VKLLRLGGIAAIELEKRKAVLKICSGKPQMIALQSDTNIAILVESERLLRLLTRIAEELEKLSKLSENTEVDLEELLYKALLIYAAVRLGYIDTVVSPENRLAIRQILEEAAKIAEIKLAKT